jgi:aryl-alcohol dehydrogenase-like predicted oxidoreductase
MIFDSNPLLVFFAWVGFKKNVMQYRKFGDTALMVSEIGFGAWAIGGAAEVGGVQIGWGPSDDQISIGALEAALDAGINFFDTADFYGLGHSEKLLGKVLGGRKDIIIATKVGQKLGREGNIEIDHTKKYILEACELSLKRLNREVIDFYQLHVAKLPHLTEGACIEAMQLLQHQGKIRYWGLSLNTFSPDNEADFLMKNNIGNGFQLVLNLINQISVPVMQKAAENGYGIIARMPLQFGLLSGKIRVSDTFPVDDHRSKRLTPLIIQNTVDILRTEMVPIAKQYNTNLAGLALSFILGFKEVSTVIPGIRSAQQVKANTQYLVDLADADHQYLRQLFEKRWQPVLDQIKQQG